MQIIVSDSNGVQIEVDPVEDVDGVAFAGTASGAVLILYSDQTWILHDTDGFRDGVWDLTESQDIW